MVYQVLLSGSPMVEHRCRDSVLRFQYSDQKGPDINVYNKEYFDNHSSYTFLL